MARGIKPRTADAPTPLYAFSVQRRQLVDCSLADLRVRVHLVLEGFPNKNKISSAFICGARVRIPKVDLGLINSWVIRIFRQRFLGVPCNVYIRRLRAYCRIHFCKLVAVSLPLLNSDRACEALDCWSSASLSAKQLGVRLDEDEAPPSC